MKKLTFIFPLLLLSFIFYLNDEIQISAAPDISAPQSNGTQTTKKLTSDYKIKVKLFPADKMIKADQEIIWRNFSGFPADELQLHLYPNALKNNKTEFAKGVYLEKEEQTGIEFISLSVNGKDASLIYFQPEIENSYDSTVAKIFLNSPVQPGDSIIIKTEYRIKLPVSVKRFGYAAGREFYFISQWFPKIGVFENGRWICSQYHYNTEFYSDFSNYEVNITVPENYTVGSSGELTGQDKLGDQNKYFFVLNNAVDFAWFASDQISSANKIFTTAGGKEVRVTICAQPENVERTNRYYNAVKNTLSFLEKNIGEYPYSTLTLVDVPRTSNLGGMEYPTLFTFHTPLFSPKETHLPEATIIHETIHQYFYAAVANNEVYEAWIDEGLTTYIEEKILAEYYSPPELYFRFIDYYPVFGINFLSFYEIPVIYSLRSIQYEPYGFDLLYYYLSDNLGSITDTSYLLPNRISYLSNTYGKPALIMHSLERYIGYNNMFEILSSYYQKYKFSRVTADDLLSTIREKSGKDVDRFLRNFIAENNEFDYKVSSIEKAEDNVYRILVENLEKGKVETELALYTDTDTTYITWDGSEDWKIFEVESNRPVIAAEIDPERKILFDKNYSNNSYTVETKYWAASSMAIRCFFWIQNALMIFGSVG